MNNINPKEDLASIRDMMEKSSKFSNLSGISIFFTGLLTIIAASLIYFDLGFSYSDIEISYSQLIKNEGNQEDLDKKIRLLIIFAGIVLTISLLVLYVTASRKTSKEGITLFNPTFKKSIESFIYSHIIWRNIFILFNTSPSVRSSSSCHTYFLWFGTN